MGPWKRLLRYHVEPYLIPITREFRFSDPSPDIVWFNWENDDNRPFGFLVFVSISSEPEITQNPGLGQMNLYLSCHFMRTKSIKGIYFSSLRLIYLILHREIVKLIPESITKAKVKHLRCFLYWLNRSNLIWWAFYESGIPILFNFVILPGQGFEPVTSRVLGPI